MSALAPGTVLAALLLGVGAVALAPVLTVRRLLRLNLPATLSVARKLVRRCHQTLRELGDQAWIAPEPSTLAKAA